jgi:uncharacterized protein YdeI (YjbR/CyaY-like superfamily)
MNGPAAARSFASASAFRAWLARHHATATELVVRCRKTGAARPGITYAEALDEALCFGWIDGVRRSVDGDTFSVRFSPRKPRSTWSRVNVAHVERLIREGRMAEPGLAAFAARGDRRTGVYSFEQRSVELSREYTSAFRANGRAWAYFQKQPPWYRRTSSHWVMSAKREDTRARRLATLIAYSAQHEPIPPLARKPPAADSRPARPDAKGRAGRRGPT